MYLNDKINCDTLLSISKDEQKIKIIEQTIFKSSINFNPTDSFLYSFKKNQNIEAGILISFVKFDGKFLRINTIVGCEIMTESQLNEEYHYQFVFRNGSISDLDWVMKNK